MTAEPLPESDTAQACSYAHATRGGDLLGEVIVPATPESAAPFRKLLRSAAALWGVPREISERAELPACEIINNAVRHGARFPGDELNLVFVRIGSRFRIEVHDPSRLLPKSRDADPLTESGRGLRLVEALSDECGAYLTPAGKAVWCEFITWPFVDEAIR